MSRFDLPDSTASVIAVKSIDERLKRVEQDAEYLTFNLDASYVKGRVRSDRNTPTSSSDVNQFDLEYDIVLTTTYQYILVNNSGTLVWRRFAISSF